MKFENLSHSIFGRKKERKTNAECIIAYHIAFVTLYLTPGSVFCNKRFSLRPRAQAATSLFPWYFFLYSTPPVRRRGN